MGNLPHFQLFIDGSRTEGASSQVMTSENPATGQGWATFACAAPEDVDRAVAAAKHALDDPLWRDLSATARGKLLYRLADLVAENASRLAELETTDSGKLLAETAAQTGYIADY